MQIKSTWKQVKGKDKVAACLVKNNAKNDIRES
jgi:hypothetical protein